MDIKKLAEQANDYIVERRRCYHACPEVSGQEAQTCAAIQKDLEAMGVEVKALKDCHGLIGTIQGGKPGRTVALRTDIDALAVREQTGLPYAAQNGNMHACGHDAHIAMLLGAAKILTQVKDQLCGTVRLLIQPAEEIAQGARQMVAQGAMEGVDAVYGAHVWGGVEAPAIDIGAGNRMAGCDLFTLTVEGVSAHGSAPNLGVDAVVAAASIIMNIQTYVSRVNDPVEPLVVTIGTIQGGSRFNIIANKVTMEGTVRYYSKATSAEANIRRIAEQTAAALGAKATLDYKYMTTPIVNSDPELNRIAEQAVVKLYGAENAVKRPAIMGSEDFCFFSDEAPGFYAFIGASNTEKGITYTNHHEKFTVDEDILHRGAAVMAQFAADYLNG